MSAVKARTTGVFARAFRVPGLDEWLPAGEYDLETELEAPSGFPDPESWKKSGVIVGAVNASGMLTRRGGRRHKSTVMNLLDRLGLREDPCPSTALRQNVLNAGSALAMLSTICSAATTFVASPPRGEPGSGSSMGSRPRTLESRAPHAVTFIRRVPETGP